MDNKQIEIRFHQLAVLNQQTKKWNIKPDELKNETRVYKQALRHNVFLKEVDIIKEKFPRENEKITKYRNNNFRQFTKEVPAKIKHGIISALNQIPIKVVSNNEKFNTWIESKPFFYKNSYYDFFTWSLNALIPYGLIDPNAILLPVPIFKSESSPINVMPVIIPYNKRFIEENGEYIIVINDAINGFWFIDKLDWWEVDMSGQVPSWTLRYNHNLGELPYENMPGLASFDEVTLKKYAESIISNTYEWLDEVMVALTSSQAQRLKMQSIIIRQAVDCKACSGDGKVVKDNQRVQCQECGGSGIAKAIGEYEDIVVKNSDIQSDGSKIIEPKYINPDVSVAEFLEKTWKDYLVVAKHTVGIDALIDQAESGEAMKKRLGTFEEFLSYLIYVFYKTHVTKFFEIVHKMLEINPSNWKDFPQIQTPKRIEIKTPEILKSNFDKATGTEKLQAAKEYYDSLYADNEILKRTMQVLVDFYPASIETNQDLQTLNLIGVYSKSEISRAKRALPIIRKIVEQSLEKATEITDEQIFEQSEAVLLQLVPDELTTVQTE